MSFTLPLDILTKQEKRDIVKKFTVKAKETQYNANPISYKCYYLNKEDNSIYLPFGCWKKYMDKELGFPNGDSKDFPKMNNTVKFVGKLLTPETDPTGRKRDQVTVVSDAIKKLKATGTVFMALYTGMGKTAMAIYISIYLRLKTVIICHFDSVRRQWPDEYEKFSRGSVRVQFVEGTNVKLDPFADVYIIGIQKAAKMRNEDFVKIGTVMIDESQIATATAFTEVLFKFHPRYLIGLSATPDRPDGLDALLCPYFGSPTKYIVRKEKKDFTVYKYITKYKPEISYTVVNGKTVPNWNVIVNSIEENSERWKEIANIAIKHPNEKIIILCNRKALSNGIYNLLLDLGESVELLIDKTKVWDKNARILVAGFKKGGVGMNDPNLTMAIIASDTKDSRQLEGRVRANNNILYHIVDNYRTFENHYSLCEAFYLEKGAKIEVIDTRGKIKNTDPPKRYLKPRPQEDHEPSFCHQEVTLSIIPMEKNLLDELKITNKKDYHVWLIKNHPDRGGNEDTCKKVIELAKTKGW